MSKNSASVDVEIYRQANSWKFSGACDDDGNLVIARKGATTITFKPKTGETWQFADPYIQFGEYGQPKNQDSIGGVLQPTKKQADEITIVDTNNESPKKAAFYLYSIHTEFEADPVIDPMIVNDGGP